MPVTAEPPGLPDAKLVRLRVTDARGWPQRLPPVPSGRVATVSVGEPDLADGAAGALERAGYRLVGVVADPRHRGPLVDVLVPDDLARAHPSWWRRLAATADGTFALAHGPVTQVLAGVLALHARALAPGGR